MKSISLVVLAAAVLAIPTILTAGSVQAGVKVTVSPSYVPAVYCSYKSKDWVQKGIVSCPAPFMPIGEPGARWKVSKTLTQCWGTYGAGGKEYSGYWRKC